MEDLKEACVPSLVFTERKGEGQRKGGMEQRKNKEVGHRTEGNEEKRVEKQSNKGS